MTRPLACRRSGRPGTTSMHHIVEPGRDLEPLAGIGEGA
jgi:hypothetical protein